MIRAAPEIVAFGGEAAGVRRVRAADSSLVTRARRGDGLGLIVTGLTVAGVLAVAVSAAAQAHLDRVLIATLALLALASFEAATPLAAAARDLFATLAAGAPSARADGPQSRRARPRAAAPAPAWPFTVALEDVRARYPRQPRLVLEGFNLRLEPGRARRAAWTHGRREDHDCQPAAALPPSGAGEGHRGGA